MHVPAPKAKLCPMRDNQHFGYRDEPLDARRFGAELEFQFEPIALSEGVPASRTRLRTLELTFREAHIRTKALQKTHTRRRSSIKYSRSHNIESSSRLTSLSANSGERLCPESHISLLRSRSPSHSRAGRSAAGLRQFQTFVHFQLINTSCLVSA